MRRVVLIVLLLLLAAGGFAGTYRFLHSPSWSLYQLGKAIHTRNASLFLAYVDVSHILSSQKDDIVDLILPDQGKQDQRDLIKHLLTAFMAPLTEQVNQQVTRIISDPQRDNLPSSWTLVVAASVERNDDNALVVLHDPRQDRRVRLSLHREKGGPWRVVEINVQDLRALVKEFVQAKSPAPTPAN